jgi:3-phosphoshikimate 1-carboxyvinyltransferase
MMLPIVPIDHPLNASICVPGSKSQTNRALLIAALSEGTTQLSNALFSDDSVLFAKALRTLGFDLTLDESNHKMRISGLGGKIPARKADLTIGDSGTSARFLSALVTLGNGEYSLDGDARMRERPIGDLVEALRQLGAKVEAIPTNKDRAAAPENQASSGNQRQICPPIKITANGLAGGKSSISGEVSSQFLSALLMVAPYAQTPVEISVSTELNSKPYVDMTIAVMQEFGVEIQRVGYSRFSISPGRYCAASNYVIEPDASAAAYFFAAPAICGGSVQVENISQTCKQGDIGFLEVLRQMGCKVVESENGIRVTGSSELRGIKADMGDIPDTAQTLAVIAPFAAGPTEIGGIGSARLKETDRVAATCAELRKLGVRVEEHQDGLTIHPCEKFKANAIRTYNDHRMAMAFALIGLRVPSIRIENPGCVSKTFPSFFETLERLR